MEKQIITISREFGSGGRLIGTRLAEKMGLPYYDKNLLDQIAKENGYSVEMMEEDEMRARNSFLYSLTNAFGTGGYGAETQSINEKFFMAQFDYITKLAENGEGGVIIGRCADYVLRNFPQVTNVFIYADEESKIKRATESYDVKGDNIRKTLASVDKARANYYKYHTGKKWGEPENYHLCINSAGLEVEDLVDLIITYVEKRAAAANK